MKKLTLLAVLLSSFLCASCTTHIPQSDSPRDPSPLPDGVFIRTVTTTLPGFTKFTKKLLDGDDSYTSFECQVISDAKDDPLSFEYLQSNKSPNHKHPVIIVYNILKDKL